MRRRPPVRVNLQRARPAPPAGRRARRGRPTACMNAQSPRAPALPCSAGRTERWRVRTAIRVLARRDRGAKTGARTARQWRFRMRRRPSALGAQAGRRRAAVKKPRRRSTCRRLGAPQPAGMQQATGDRHGGAGGGAGGERGRIDFKLGAEAKIHDGDAGNACGSGGIECQAQQAITTRGHIHAGRRRRRHLCLTM